jgi:ATP-dependent helicase IRC3
MLVLCSCSYSYRRLLARFDPAITSPDAVPAEQTQAAAPTHKIPIIGVSATFSRHDGLALGSVFEQIVYHHDFLSMIKDQWLSTVRFTTVKAAIDLSAVTVSSRSGDFQASSLAHVINTESINELVLKTWLDKAGSSPSSPNNVQPLMLAIQRTESRHWCSALTSRTYET